MDEDHREAGGSQDDTVTLTIDGRNYRVAGGPVTGATLRELPSPPIGSDFDLVLMGAEGDLLIREDEIVELRDGLEFFAVPRRILAGSEADRTPLTTLATWKHSITDAA